MTARPFYSLTSAGKWPACSLHASRHHASATDDRQSCQQSCQQVTFPIEFVKTQLQLASILPPAGPAAAHASASSPISVSNAPPAASHTTAKGCIEHTWKTRWALPYL